MAFLGQPCNQFGGQEPGDNSEILHCVQYVRPGNGYIIPSNMAFTEKGDVNGLFATPLFKSLKSSCGAADVGWNVRGLHTCAPRAGQAAPPSRAHNTHAPTYTMHSLRPGALARMASPTTATSRALAPQQWQRTWTTSLRSSKASGCGAQLAAKAQGLMGAQIMTATRVLGVSFPARMA